MQFSDKLKALRKAKGLTQKELSEETGLSVHAINSYETGRREPNYNAMAILERYFKEEGISLYGTSKYDFSSDFNSLFNDKLLDGERLSDLTMNIYRLMSSEYISYNNKNTILDMLNNQLENMHKLLKEK